MSTAATHKTFFDFFPVPDFMLLATSGIAISDESVKLVEFKKSGQGGDLELLHASESMLPKGALEGGFIYDKGAIVEALKEFQNHLGLKYVRAALPEEKAYLFTAFIDEVPLSEVHDAVAFIIEENAPIALSESVFDFEIIGRVENHPGIKVAVSVLPKIVIDTYTDLFNSAELTPIAFDLESQAIARAVVPRGDRRSTLIINLGERKTGLYVIEDGIVQFSLTPSFGMSDQGASSNTDLRSEIRKLFIFWNTRLNKHGIPEKKIERVVVSGPGAANKTFIDELLSGVEVEYSVANVWKNALLADAPMPDIAFEKSLGYAAAIGLALGTRKPNNHV